MRSRRFLQMSERLTFFDLWALRGPHRIMWIRHLFLVVDAASVQTGISSACYHSRVLAAAVLEDDER
jgi:hypothetical protein